MSTPEKPSSWPELKELAPAQATSQKVEHVRQQLVKMSPEARQKLYGSVIERVERSTVNETMRTFDGSYLSLARLGLAVFADKIEGIGVEFKELSTEQDPDEVLLQLQQIDQRELGALEKHKVSAAIGHLDYKQWQASQGDKLPNTEVTTMAAYLRTKLKPGQLLFFNWDNRTLKEAMIHKGIQAISADNAAEESVAVGGHIAFWDGEMVVHVTDGKGRRQTLEEVMQSSFSAVAIGQLPDTINGKDLATAATKANGGVEHYDDAEFAYLAVDEATGKIPVPSLQTQFVKHTDNPEGKDICSGIIVLALNEIGAKGFDTHKTPMDFYRDPRVHILTAVEFPKTAQQSAPDTLAQVGQ